MKPFIQSKLNASKEFICLQRFFDLHGSTKSTETYFKQVHAKKSLKTTLERNVSFSTFKKTL